MEEYIKPSNTFILFEELKETDYDKQLIWLSSESLLDNKELFEKDSRIAKLTGKVLIDQLFLTGNNENRFIACDIQNGKISLKTAKIVSPTDICRKKTMQWLHDNYRYIKNLLLILTEDEKEKIRNNIAF